MDFINAILVLLNYTIIPALTYGSQLALGAIFVTLIYGVLRFANFATGDMMSFGTMFAVLLTYYFQSLGINLGSSCEIHPSILAPSEDPPAFEYALTVSFFMSLNT